MRVTDPLHHFSAATARWFRAAFPAPTPVQQLGWPLIAGGAHTLMLAPTGSGKTLAAFLAALDRVCQAPGEGVQVVYVSPLKALAVDVERNLQAPLVGIRRAAEALGAPVGEVRVGVRTGDTPARQRVLDRRRPPQILVTTPESLYLMLSSGARELLTSVHTVIVDEIHVMAGSKRGAHLALSLERLCARCAVEPQRIGLSATQRPLDEIAGFLGGDRPVEIVDASAQPRMRLEVRSPVPDLDAPAQSVDPPPNGSPFEHPMSAPGAERAGAWVVLLPAVLELVRQHRSTIVFTNSRRLAERVNQRLNELAEAAGLSMPLSAAHHGSIALAQRSHTEAALKAGLLPCIVATSSLELGIDMGAVDLVIQVGAPPSVAAGLQRVGRAGHHVGGESVGVLLPRFKGELLEAAAVAEGMREGAIERTHPPRSPLDVLAQQIVAMCMMDEQDPDALLALCRRARPYRGLDSDAFLAVVEMLAGQLARGSGAAWSAEAEAAADHQRPRLIWDRATNRLRARPDARLIVLSNVGTIPDRGLWPVHIAPDGPRVGELDEEMVHESRRGDVFSLGASSWRIMEIKRDRVLVSPAPGEPGRMPFWRGEGPGRPLDLGLRMGALARELHALDDAEGRAILTERCGLNADAATNLLSHLRAQTEGGGLVPTDERVVVERFRDEFGDWRVCVLAPLGARVLAPWALAIAAGLEERTGHAAQVNWTDDGIVLRLDDGEAPPDLVELLPDPDEVRDRALRQLDRSSLFAARFREAAGRALLLPRRRPGQRTPLYLQRMRAQSLLAVARATPRHPLVLETFRECLQDAFDLDGLTATLRRIRERSLRVEEVETRSPSAFAISLVYSFVASWLYEQDAPLAERRAAGLSVDRALLRRLLGDDHLEELLDEGEMRSLEAELQGLTAERQAQSLDGLHDLLRRVGDLRFSEVEARCAAPVEAWLTELQRQGRAARVRLASEERWVAAEDLARLRDALGVVTPAGAVAATTPTARPIESLTLRFARTHAPFSTDELAARFGLVAAQVEPVLRLLAGDGALVGGRFRAGEGPVWCDREVLARLKRRTLARLRDEVEPVEPEVFARFVASWQGIGDARAKPARRALDAVLGRLEGARIAASELSTGVLRSRGVLDDAAALDQLIASGELVWVGAGGLGPRDGRLRLLRPELVPLLHRLGPAPAEGSLAARLLRALEDRGACFLVELLQSLGASATPRWGAALTLNATFGRDPRPAAAGPERSEVEAALWGLAWDGLVSNDSLASVRAWCGVEGGGRARAGGGGRWWSLRRAFAEGLPQVDDTHRARAAALMTLERYGVVGSTAAVAEELPGGFAGVYPVLCEMESLGHVRRGWFVAGLGGSWFALPGAVEELRAYRERADLLQVLPTCDPGQPWGALLPWPAALDGQWRREAGSWMVLLGGAPTLWLGRSGHSLGVHLPDGADAGLADAITALARRLEQAGQRAAPIRRINGEETAASPLLPRLRAAGMLMEGGLLLPVRR
ncbi:MAG: DEAD/DEAH box helicase [Deltaproteobacteria bacterium]|nr:DEAD/DEAH box helicase [Deltaproteobacteria bacterium]